MGPSELSQEEIDALLSRAAERARKASDSARSEPGATTHAGATTPSAGTFEALLDVPVEVKVRLGEAEMPIEEVAALGEGSVVALDRAPGDPVDIIVNGRLFARGEIVVVDDRFTVRVTEILAAGGSTAGPGAVAGVPRRDRPAGDEPTKGEPTKNEPTKSAHEGAGQGGGS